MYKKWRYQEVDSSLVEEISSKNNISELLATVLINRGIKTKKEKVQTIYFFFLL